MKKIIFVASLFAFTMLLLNSCVDHSKSREIKILKNQELIFSEEESDATGFKSIIVIDSVDTVVIDYWNIVSRICYLKKAYPEEDITIYYCKNKKGDISFVDINMSKHNKKY